MLIKKRILSEDALKPFIGRTLSISGVGYLLNKLDSKVAMKKHYFVNSPLLNFTSIHQKNYHGPSLKRVCFLKMFRNTYL